MATCEICNCPLTVLRVRLKVYETRSKCARCSDEATTTWKPKKLAIDKAIEEGTRRPRTGAKSSKPMKPSSLH